MANIAKKPDWASVHKEALIIARTARKALVRERVKSIKRSDFEAAWDRAVDAADAILNELLVED